MIDLDAHDEQNALRFEAQAERERQQEAKYRERAERHTRRAELDTAFGLHRLASERATRAQAFTEAARMLRHDIARRRAAKERAA
jgi:hypothetical protein